MDSFEKLVTENDERIDYVGLLGAKYQYKNWSVNAEYLNSKDYLKSMGRLLNINCPCMAWCRHLTRVLFSRVMMASCLNAVPKPSWTVSKAKTLTTVAMVIL